MALVAKPELLILDEIGYLALDQFGATCLFQRVSDCFEQAPMTLTSNKSYVDLGSSLQDNVIASAILDRLLHHSTTINVKGEEYRLKDKDNMVLLFSIITTMRNQAHEEMPTAPVGKPDDHLVTNLSDVDRYPHGRARGGR